MQENILITNCTLVRQGFVLEQDHYILIENNRIKTFGPMKHLDTNQGYDTLDGTGKLAIPGLINGHNHSPMVLFRGMADDLELHEWLENHIFPAEIKSVAPDMVYWCAKLATAEMMLSGTTYVADGYFHCHEIAQAFADCKMRATVAHGILDFPAPGVPDPHDNIRTVATFLADWKDKNPLIQPAVFAHSPYTCSPGTLKQAKKLADDHNTRFFIHLSETQNEQKMVIKPQGRTPVEHLDNLGILDGNCIIIHAVWLDDSDIELIRQSKAKVILCPQSNYKLASGKSPVEKMMNHGIAPGLGTDGAASNNSLDMFREMDLFSKSQKGFYSDPTIFPAKEVFQMATVNTGNILGLEGTGEIKEGNIADLVLLNLNQPHLTPFYNQDLLVYAVKGSDVDTVIINGQIVVKEKHITSFDLEETKEKVRNLALT